MDDIKLFAKNEKEFESLIHYSQDLGMEFGIEKCPMLVMTPDGHNGTTKPRQN